MATGCDMTAVYTGFGREREQDMRRGLSRRMMLASAAAAGVAPRADARPIVSAPRRAEQWGMVEITLRGGGADVPIHNDLAFTFQHGAIEKTVPAFWDGEDIFRVRFMPETQGVWTWRVEAGWPWRESGAIQVGPPSHVNHGPV